jgi:uncharacterized protein YjbI with pentapeptide repeats
MTADELAKILEDHAKWLRGDGGSRADLSRARADLSRADLSGADLSGADLSRADLSGAYLSGANLSRAYLSGANLYGAYLSGANLSRANLSRANLSRANLYGAYLYGANLSRANLSRADLSRANLSGADLSGANLYGTCLAAFSTPFDWASTEHCEMRCIDNRTLVLALPRNQPHMGGASYKLSRLYRAPHFSRDPATACHPGLYIETGPHRSTNIAPSNRMLVAVWMDEMHVVTKCRVPRFRTLSCREEFHRLTAEDMERDRLSIYTGTRIEVRK